MKYQSAPNNDQYKDWSGYAQESFVPTARQQVLIYVINVALLKGLYYTDDILKFAIEYLEIPADVANARSKNVEGGDVGMDMYYARNYVRAQKGFAEIKKAHEKLKPYVGMVLGSLRIDFKRVNCCVVQSVDGTKIGFSGKRGSVYVIGYANSVNLIDSAQGAFAKNWRKALLV